MKPRKDRSTTLRLMALLSVFAALLSLVGISRAANAAYPIGAGQQAPGSPPVGSFGPLENTSPTFKTAPAFTTAPSARVTNDPHWRSPNIRANTDTTTYAQQEPAIAVNPLNPLNVVVANKDERNAPSPGSDTKQVYIETSTDGGLTWPVQVNVPMPDTSLPQQSDPVLNFSDDNSVYLTIIGFQTCCLNTNLTMVARSTDGGLTWSPAVALDAGLGGSDKEWTAIDLNPASPYYHRIYTTWTNFSAGPQFIEKWSSDNGVTWNPPGGTNYVTVSYGSYDTGQFSMPVVLPNGTVIATWYVGGRIGVGRSTNGGQSFINPNTPGPLATGVNLVPGSAWRLNTIPSTAASQATSTIITTWADGRNGKDDIYFSRSTDAGLTWSPGARLPHNPAGSSYQVEPWISVAPNGRFDVIWYDDRDFVGTNPNIFHIYASHSTDDGLTWSPDEQVTDASTNLNVGIPTGSGWNAAAGDYIGVTSLNSGAYAVWTDTRSGTNEDVYTSLYTAPVGPETPTPTWTVAPPTATSTGTPTATSVPPTFTETAVPSTSTPTVTATPCAITFTDVGPTDYFYTAVQYLYCHGAISGYSDNTFRPFNSTTRGQLSKIVVLAEQFPIDTTGGPHFTDVPTSNPFYPYIETAYNRGLISGYSDGTFRWGNNVTRAQLSKIIVIAEGWPIDTTNGPHFTDVPTTDPFYSYIETAYNHGIVAGYSDNTFRPGNDATRGQISVIVYRAISAP